MSLQEKGKKEDEKDKAKGQGSDDPPGSKSPQLGDASREPATSPAADQAASSAPAASAGPTTRGERRPGEGRWNRGAGVEASKTSLSDIPEYEGCAKVPSYDAMKNKAEKTNFARIVHGVRR